MPTVAADAYLPWTWSEKSPNYNSFKPTPPTSPSFREISPLPLKIARWCMLNLSIPPLCPHQKLCGLLPKSTEAYLWAETPCLSQQPAPGILPASCSSKRPGARALDVTSQESRHRYSVPASAPEGLCTARWDPLFQAAYFISEREGCQLITVCLQDPPGRCSAPKGWANARMAR